MNLIDTTMSTSLIVALLIAAVILVYINSTEKRQQREQASVMERTQGLYDFCNFILIPVLKRIPDVDKKQLSCEVMVCHGSGFSDPKCYYYYIPIYKKTFSVQEMETLMRRKIIRELAKFWGCDVRQVVVDLRYNGEYIRLRFGRRS